MAAAGQPPAARAAAPSTVHGARATPPRAHGESPVQGEHATPAAQQSPVVRAGGERSAQRELATDAVHQAPAARASGDLSAQREHALATAHQESAVRTPSPAAERAPLRRAEGATAPQVGRVPSSSATSAQPGADRVVIDPRSLDVALKRTNPPAKSANEPPAPGARAVPETQLQQAKLSPSSPGVDPGTLPTALGAELRPRNPTPAPAALPVAAASEKPQVGGRLSLEEWLATPAKRPATPTPVPQPEPPAPMKSTRATIANPSRTPPPAEATQPALPAATWEDDDEWESSKTFEPLRPRQKSAPVTVREALASTAEPSTPASAQGAEDGPEELLRYRTRTGPILLGVAIALLLLAALVSWLSNGPQPQASPPAVETAAPEFLEPGEPAPSVLAEWKPWEPPPALEAAPTTEPDAPAADLAAPLKEARDLYEAGRLKEATTAVQALLDANPSSTEAWVLLGQVRFDSRDLPGARAASTQALTLDPKFPRGLMLQAALAIDAKDLPAARDALERVLAVDPKGPDAAEARALLAQGL
jgi:cytochrome c-type biogenesis protein CcmH/NrfG